MNPHWGEDEQGSGTGETLLIVDDAPENLAVLGGLLEPLYRVRAVNSGERALRAAKSSPRPELILLDIMMPDMDGYEVLRRLSADVATADIPVIFITAKMDEEDELLGFELGAADYIHKPIRGAIVLSRVRAQLDAKVARDMLRRYSERLAQQVEAGAQALERAQLQLLQSEKLASIGQLAAGVAHEINTPVGFVGSNLNTLESYVGSLGALLDAYGRVEDAAADKAPFSEVVALRQQLDIPFLRQDMQSLFVETQDGIDRVRRIAQELKDYSRIGNRDWQWTDLHQGLDSTLNMIRHEIKNRCTVHKEYGAIPRVRCLPAQINQVFMNLILNAAQAIEDKGTISIVTTCAGDDAVSVRITDTGRGIAAENLDSIFEPFFTTKPVGQGTGLGLPLVREILDRHKGRIEVASTLGEGTSFIVTLPIDAEVEGGER